MVRVCVPPALPEPGRFSCAEGYALNDPRTCTSAGQCRLVCERGIRYLSVPLPRDTIYTIKGLTLAVALRIAASAELRQTGS